MRCDPKTKGNMAKSTTKSLTIQHNSWISYSGHICVSPSNFDHSSFWGCSMTKWSMTSSFTNSAQFLLTNFQTQFLKLLPLFNWNCLGTHHDIHISFQLYHGGCMQFCQSGCNRCWLTNLSGRGMSILTKTFEQLMLWQDLTRQNNWGFSIESHLLIQLSS